MRGMTDGAALPQCRVLKDNRLGLFPMTLSARLIQTGHGQARRRFHDVLAVGIMALNAIHLAFQDGMVLRKMEFGLLRQVALETGFRILAGVDDEFSATTAARHMFAPRAVAGFATVLLAATLQMQPGMRAGGKYAADVGVAFLTGFVSNKRCSLYLRRGEDAALDSRTRVEQQSNRTGACRDEKCRQLWQLLHVGLALLRVEYPCDTIEAPTV